MKDHRSLNAVALQSFFLAMMGLCCSLNSSKATQVLEHSSVRQSPTAIRKLLEDVALVTPPNAEITYSLSPPPPPPPAPVDATILLPPPPISISKRASDAGEPSTQTGTGSNFPGFVPVVQTIPMWLQTPFQRILETIWNVASNLPLIGSFLRSLFPPKSPPPLPTPPPSEPCPCRNSCIVNCRGDPDFCKGVWCYQWVCDPCP
eukprot:jgi/Botrbrau1/14872/Bobra.0298s0006.1